MEELEYDYTLFADDDEGGNDAGGDDAGHDAPERKGPPGLGRGARAGFELA